MGAVKGSPATTTACLPPGPGGLYHELTPDIDDIMATH